MIGIICKACGEEFLVYPCRKDSAKYCSLNCRNKDYKGKHFSKETEFRKGQKFGEKRNEKISDALKGRIPWNKGKRKLYKHICKFCGESFFTKTQHRAICNKKDCKSKRGTTRKIRPEIEEERRKKISKKLSGKIPSNLRRNVRCKDSPRQKALFKIVKKYFPSVKYNYLVRTSHTKRFLDVAIPELKLDFEYNGKCHLLKSVIENDRRRTKELVELGWRIIVFDRNNFYGAEKFIKKLRQTINKKLEANGDV